jgi:hypothetical protein
MGKKKAVRKIVLIKDWGSMKKGEEILDPSDVTIEALCFRHKFGKLEGDSDFVKRMKLKKLTAQKLAQDIAFSGSPEKESPKKKEATDLSDIVETMDEPAPKEKEKATEKKK